MNHFYGVYGLSLPVVMLIYTTALDAVYLKRAAHVCKYFWAYTQHIAVKQIKNYLRRQLNLVYEFEIRSVLVGGCACCTARATYKRSGIWRRQS